MNTRKLIQQCTKEVNSWPKWKRDQLKDLFTEPTYEPDRGYNDCYPAFKFLYEKPEPTKEGENE